MTFPTLKNSTERAACHLRRPCAIFVFLESGARPAAVESRELVCSMRGVWGRLTGCFGVCQPRLRFEPPFPKS